MIKKIVLLILLTNSFMLTSCLYRGGPVYVGEERAAKKRIKEILAAIENKDKEAMKALFSKKALAEVNDFDEGVDYLFDFFQGDVQSWEIDAWSSGESIERGKKSIMLRVWYIVTTDKEKYMFFVIDYIKDTMNPDNAGLYTLRVIKAEDEETEFGYWQDMVIPGIYKPEQ
ncbi:MAG TPA: DUF5104 domain-containing protein [Hungateiclostridium thermocellum]|uniref:DUF5104 domain-containing protein n=2 Tax=Acetivibrio thermocellus TaxID=1515 RepID=A3DKE1_ACET2|nr:hypothetical protein Cthe_3225 [Acetivibrio thermocellus ATCC 27405]ADU73850.1 hypothetical protein Clo1313_0777 [Acetivibrio thermocellus DSM 1313]ALX07787.1 hypothetical protein AD2_00789 [Acetivibrio thermocellus AD2]ANV75529.1 hypothetical protein LQRI_0788 [Acetivibrio thermocellus DSM 2360]EIC04712.1 hypothetical protein YSBL_0111 [Acetivibrio thermocellus YS]NLU26984.1 DUF5104 domain-containing protein [Acetivibrio thermocellus]CDG37704.1 hypothetical protein CTHBC1_3147 [Acetivibri